MSDNQIICGDAIQVLKGMPNGTVDCCVTSPPYWGLRDYGVEGQLGLEKTPELFVEKMVDVFREVRRVLKKEGTLWLNLGDTFYGGGRNRGNTQEVSDKQKSNWGASGDETCNFEWMKHPVLKPKDLCGIPWRVAFALQADGWWLRQDIVWSKPNPMPESVTDRCTKAHEYIFLMTKSAKYYFDKEAIKEEATGYDGRKDIIMKGSPKYASGFIPYQSTQTIAVRGHERWQTRKNNGTEYGGNGTGFQNHSGYSNLENPYIRNKRSVWTVSTQPYSEAHFAVFPEKLIEPCVLAGCPEWVCAKCGKARERISETTYEKHGKGTVGGRGRFSAEDNSGFTGKPNMRRIDTTVGFTDCGCKAGWGSGIILDPFFGAGTTGLVAYKNRRDYIGIELNGEYIKMATNRIHAEKDKMGLFAESEK